MAVHPLAFAAVSLLLGASAQSTAGAPIQGIPIGLKGDPGTVVSPLPSNARGEATFTVGPGRYSVFLVDPGAPVELTFTPANYEVSQTVALQPGRGRVYATDAGGRRLLVVIARTTQVRITLTEPIFDRWGRQNGTPR